MKCVRCSQFYWTGPAAPEATGDFCSSVCMLAQVRDDEISQLRAQNAKLRNALLKIVDVDDRDKSGRALVFNQGQGMDGYTKLAEYEAATKAARAALEETKP